MINTYSLRSAIREAARQLRKGRGEALAVVLIVTLLTTLSGYFGSRAFFRANLAMEWQGQPIAGLHEYLYWFSSTFVLYFVLPLTVILTLHRRPLRDYGLGIGNWRLGLKATAVSLAVMMPILWIASDAEAFRAMYPHALGARDHWDWFVLYEAGFLLYFAGWEFLWRGYMQYGLARTVGLVLAIVIQTLPFVLLHHGKPFTETLGSIAAGIGLGFLSAFSRSFWYCVVIHWTVMFSIDLLCTLRYRLDIVGIGPDALWTLFSRLLSV